MSEITFGQREILDTLRMRICLTPPETTYPLQEIAVSKEFNVSRTPVRQVLQTLARERLVDIRPSVGASVSILPPESRLPCFLVYRDITALAASLADRRPVGEHVKMEIVGVLGIVRSIRVLTPETYVSLSIRSQVAIASLVQDPVVRDALLASFWRIIRWSVLSLETDPEDHLAAFRDALEQAAEVAHTGCLADLLRRITVLIDQVFEKI